MIDQSDIRECPAAEAGAEPKAWGAVLVASAVILLGAAGYAALEIYALSRSSMIVTRNVYGIYRVQDLETPEVALDPRQPGNVTQSVLLEWIDLGGTFPDKVSAFHDAMAVHGKYKQPCPVCAAPVQRICYASKEANYCAGCQTEGRLLKGRALSRLLKKDWPKTLEELERLPCCPTATVGPRSGKALPKPLS